ncbi:MAG: MFS transporter [Niabella sp.]
MGKSFSVDRSVKLTIIGYVSLTFLGYFTIGLSLAVLPVFVHDQLGYNTVIAGSVIGVQYVSTFLLRIFAGRMVDKYGPKLVVLCSMGSFIISNLCLILAFALYKNPVYSLGVLVLSRLLTGCAEGFIGASPINWAMLRVGNQYTANAISYNGIATYSAMAFGAPLGVLLSQSIGNWLVGIAGMLLAGLALWLTIIKKPLYGVKTETDTPFFKVFKTVVPYGLGLGLAGIGFATISTFITLFFNFKQWGHAAIGITAFSVLFVVGRLVFTKSIITYGGIRITIFSMIIECIGLFIIGIAPDPYIAIVGCALAGLGFSIVFPALGVVAVDKVPESSKGMGLGAYGVFSDLSLGVTGPLVGFVSKEWGMQHIFWFSCFMVLAGIVLCSLLLKKHPQ